MDTAGSILLLVLSSWIFNGAFSQIGDSNPRHLYISQNANQSCGLGNDSCYTLSQLAQNSQIFSLFDRIVLHFSDGNHILNAQNNNVLKFENATQVRLVGRVSTGVSPTYTSIDCMSTAGFLFQSVDYVEIINLAFVQCQGLYILNSTTNITSALVFRSLRTLNIQNVTVRNSSGYGLYAANVHQILVQRSSLLYNTAGNGMLIWAWNKNACQNSSSNFNVSFENSLVANGGSLSDSLSSVGGLRMDFDHSCGKGNVHLRAVKMLSNSAYFGGGFGVNFGPGFQGGVDISVEKCSFEKGLSYRGGGISLIAGSESSENTVRQSFSITNSWFESNIALEAGGAMYTIINSQLYKQYISISNVSILNNSVIQRPEESSNEYTGHGGGIFFRFPPSSLSSFWYEKLTFKDNVAHTGGGVYILYTMDLQNDWRNYSTLIYPYEEASRDRIAFSTFTKNQATFGAALNVEVASLTPLFPVTKELDLYDVVFKNNCARLNAPAMAITGTSGVIHFVLNHVTFSLNHVLNYPDSFDGGLMIDSATSMVAASPAALLVSNVDSLSLTNCTFTDNLVGGLAAILSSLDFIGTFRCVNNTSINGGGIALYSSEIHLSNFSSEIIFEGNSAQERGGAIFIYDNPQTVSFRPMTKQCFIQMDNILTDDSYDHLDCLFSDNSAGVTGSMLYGGNLDRCEHAMKLFDSKCLANYSTNSKLEQSLISSDPVQLCVCENEEVVCNVRTINIITLPGEPFTIAMVALGQRNGTTPAVVSLHFAEESHESYHHILNGKLNTLSLGCTNVTYTIVSSRSSEDLKLRVGSGSSKDTLLNMSVNFLPCPRGFTLQSPTHNCQCAQALENVEGIKCNDVDHTIERKESMWIDYSCSHLNSSPSDCVIRLHDSCPYSYCNDKVVQVTLDLPNSMCTGNRAGILCGECKQNYSMILGGSECWDCTGKNRYLALIIFFAVAGILLIVLLTVVKLTISLGTINGLLFYAAVVQLNRTSYFPTAFIDNFNFLTMFISWLNLDFGIRTCFYEAMSPEATLSFQLAFPLYIVFLVLAIHFTSRNSSSLSRLTGASQRVAISSTILLFAYMKILRVMITTLPYTDIPHDHLNGTLYDRVWLYNGNLRYFEPEHLPLFVVSIIFLLLVAVPFTSLLLFGWFLFRVPMFVNRYPGTMLKLKIILDAYSGRNKVRSQSWFGVIVLTYTIQLIVFHGTGGEVYINLVMAILGACFLLSISLVLGGVYKSKYINLLEWFFLLNIIVTSALTIQLRRSNGSLATASSISTTAALVAFICIVVHHCYREFPVFSKLVRYCISTRCSYFPWSKLITSNVSFRYSELHQSDEECGYQSDQQEQIPDGVHNTDRDHSFSSTTSNPNNWVPTAYPTPYFREHPDLLSGTEDDYSQSSSERRTKKTIVDQVEAKSISSSLLIVRPGHDDEVADLVPNDVDGMRKQTALKDDDGVSTLIIEDSGHSTRPSILSYLPPVRKAKTISTNSEPTPHQEDDHDISHGRVSRDTSKTVKKALDTSTTTQIALNLTSDDSTTSFLSNEKSSQQTLPYSKIHRRIQRKSSRQITLSSGNGKGRKQTKKLRSVQTMNDIAKDCVVQSKVHSENRETVLSTCVSTQLLLSPISILEVTHSGKTFHDKEQGVSLEIPEGAVPKGVTALVEIGILAHGPFECPSSVTRVSPILWLCCEQPVQFKKDIVITLPHCLKKITNADCDNLHLLFMKADHNVQHTSSGMFSFTPLHFGTKSEFYSSKGILRTNHCCFFCITANKTSQLFLKKVEYCLTRIDPKPWCLETTMFFCVSYFLKTCFQALEKQFPKDAYEVKSRTCFQFAPRDGISKPKLKIEVQNDTCRDWHLVVENPGSREIAAAELEFCTEDEQTLLLKHECGMYPPRFHLRVSGSSARSPSSALIRFKGATSNIDCEIFLQIPPSSGACNYRPVTPSRPTRETTSNQLSSRRSFFRIVEESNEFDGLFYEPGWDDLDRFVVCKVATHWQAVGIQLRIKPEKLDSIRSDHHRSGVQDMFRKVLQEWSKRGSPPFQWAYLIRALQAETVGEEVLAQQLLDELRCPISYD